MDNKLVISVNGKKDSLRNQCDIYGVKRPSIYRYVRQGWTHEQAILHLSKKRIDKELGIKKCAGVCGKTRPFSEFYRNGRGHFHKCKECILAPKRALTRQKIKERWEEIYRNDRLKNVKLTNLAAANNNKA